MFITYNNSINIDERRYFYLSASISKTWRNTANLKIDNKYL